MVVSLKQTPLTTASNLQINRQVILSRLRRAWSNLSDADRRSWYQLALQLQQLSPNNGQYPRRPYTLFLAYNELPCSYDGTITTAAPPSYQTEAISNFQATVLSFPLVLFATVVPGISGSRYQRMSIRLGQRGNQRSALGNWFTLKTAYSSTTLFNLTSNYTSHFGNPIPGQLWEAKATIQRVGYFPSFTPLDRGTTV